MERNMSDLLQRKHGLRYTAKWANPSPPETGSVSAEPNSKPKGKGWGDAVYGLHGLGYKQSSEEQRIDGGWERAISIFKFFSSLVFLHSDWNLMCLIFSVSSGSLGKIYQRVIILGLDHASADVFREVQGNGVHGGDLLLLYSLDLPWWCSFKELSFYHLILRGWILRGCLWSLLIVNALPTPYQN